MNRQGSFGKSDVSEIGGIKIGKPLDQSHRVPQPNSYNDALSNLKGLGFQGDLRVEAKGFHPIRVIYGKFADFNDGKITLGKGSYLDCSEGGRPYWKKFQNTQINNAQLSQYHILRMQGVNPEGKVFDWMFQI